MPTMSKIRLTNILYEDGNKRFNDEVFVLDGENSAIVLENGGGKTVLIHTVLQAVLPHTDLGDRKIKDTLRLENAPAHIGIEWIISEQPRRYLTTAVSLFQHNNQLTSYRYVFEYEGGHPESLQQMPFVIQMDNGKKRPANKDEMNEYYLQMKNRTYNASTFDTIGSFHDYLENHYQIIHDEWKSIVKINRDEGGIDAFFDHCKTDEELFNRLIIPIVEDSIAGHKDNMFADMFEKQRASFRMYRNLQESMKEHQSIQNELEAYVKEYKNYSDVEATYQEALKKAKGIRDILKKEQIANEQTEADNEAEWEIWHETDAHLKKKQASFQIIQLEERANELTEVYKEKLAVYEITKEKMQANEQLLASLLYAKHREAKEAYEQQRTMHEKDMNEYADAHDIAADKAELESVKQSLHGYYITALEAISKVITGKNVKKTPLENTVAEVSGKLGHNETELQETRDELAYVKGQLTAPQARNDDLKQKLLANPEQENVRTFFERWTDRQQVLEEQMIDLKKEKQMITDNITALLEKKETDREAITNIDLHINHLKSTEQTTIDLGDRLKDKLASLRPSWQALDDLYLQEARIAATLEDMQEKKRKEREDAIYKERLASRFVDDYDAQDIFFSDPFLAERINEWQNQFFILTGFEYIGNLDEVDRKYYETYPLWPLTLVTREADKEKLEGKVTEVKARLQYPIMILTLEEAKEPGETAPRATWIAPAHWENNQTQEAFDGWKTAIRKEAESMTEERKQKDKALSEVEEVVRDFEQYFTDYPKTMFDELLENLQSAHKEKEKLTRELEKQNTTIHQQETAHQVAAEKLEQVQDEKHGLERKIELASEYMQNEKMIETLQGKIETKETDVEQLSNKNRQLQRTIERYRTDILLIDEAIRDQQEEKRILQSEELFQEVNNLTPQFTEASKTVLVERKKILTDRIRGIQQQYGVLEVKFEQAVKDIKRSEEAMKEVLTDYEVVDTAIAFPVDGEKQIGHTKSMVQQNKQKLEEQRIDAEAANKSETEAITKTKIGRENYNETYPGEKVVQFDCELEAIPAYLEEKERLSAERKSYLEKVTIRITKEKKEINEAIGQLEKYEVAHHFNHPGIIATPLTEAEQTAFPYDRMTYVIKRTEELEKQLKKLNTAKDNIDQEKSKFRSFCRETISEYKLQKMAIDGIELKNNYDDVLEFRHHMVTTLERAQMHARDFISKNDKEVQAFINSIHNHLLNVTEQLRRIPKNTRVKTEDKWKEIYKFNIPEWKEEDGKSKIRDHMYWILKQLESDRFKDDEAREDTMKIRKEVEKWLQTKQLLQIVMGNQEMKASCRKVTNDNQVSSGLTSWKESNSWSGGEKWSKNMTLFLGILNFVAEKKQHVTVNMQRYRAVILDNPFGKASSDHVLSPVFFIAEQLGFQIIALTAHIEGKFVQDYFPVNFSCRLVPAIDSSAQIMTKEKNFEHVYFQDHAPEEIARLEEREQMELF